MKIALFKSPGFRVGWTLASQSDMRIRYPLEDKLPNHQGSTFIGIEGILPEKSGLIVECNLICEHGEGRGFSACSFEDNFSFGKGMKLSLERALDRAMDMGKFETKPLWEALLADGVIGKALRNEDERIIRNGVKDRIQGILYKIGS